MMFDHEDMVDATAYETFADVEAKLNWAKGQIHQRAYRCPDAELNLVKGEDGVWRLPRRIK